MAIGIENEAALGDAFRLYFSVEDTRFIKNRTLKVVRVRGDHRTSSCQDEILVLPGNGLQQFERLVIRLAQGMEPFDHFSPTQNAARGNDKALAFKSVMPAGKLVELFYRRPLRNVKGFVLGMHGCPGQRHPMFPADQASQMAIFGVEYTQRTAVSPPPNHPLCVSGRQLAVQLEFLPVSADSYHRVV